MQGFGIRGAGSGIERRRRSRAENAEIAEKGCTTALPAPPAYGRRQEGHEISKTNSGRFNALLVFEISCPSCSREARGAGRARAAASLFLFSACSAVSARDSSFGNSSVLDAQDDGGPSSGKVVVVRGDEDRPILTAEPREQLPELVAS